MTAETTTDIHKGLVGVVADTTAISKVNPDTNSLLYRGYPVTELAEHCDVEQVAWLLWHGELPTDAELDAFRERERAGRRLDPVVRGVIDAIPVTAHPMDVLRSAVSVLGARALGSDDDVAPAERLFAAIPAMVAYDQRRRRGDELIEPDDRLDYSENFLAMTFGVVPGESAVAAFRTSMILYAEHSFNASTFTARVITSTRSDVYSAVVGAIGALKGPLHGGANEAVMAVFDEIGDESAAEAWLDAARAEHRTVMGFGHRVYKKGDSRVPAMRAALDRLAAETGADDLMRLYARLESLMIERTGIYPNLDYPSGPAYRLLGFDTTTFTPLFVASRVIGWTAHIAEQAAANSLIRPLSAYSGPDERHLPA